MGVVVELLGKQAGRSGFSCGQPDMDDWFRHRAGQDVRKKVAQVYVAMDDEFGLAGFYSLSSYSIGVADMPEEWIRKLPRYDAVPAARIGRLARDLRVKGKGSGELLLADAVQRLLAVSDQVGIFAIVADAKDARAEGFYRSFGFQNFPLHPNRLFLPMATALRGR